MPSTPTLPPHTHRLVITDRSDLDWRGGKPGKGSEPWDWLSPQELPAKEERPPQAGLGSALSVTIVPLPSGSGRGASPRTLPGDSREGKGGPVLMGAVSHAATQPSPAVRAGKGFFPNNQIYKGILAPGKGSPRAERSTFLSAPSAARHPQKLQGPG